MLKKGQITIFVVIGILIVVAVVAVLAFSGGGFFERIVSGYPKEVNDVKKDMQSCLDSSLERAVVINSLQGGVYGFSREYFAYPGDVNLGFISTYYNDSQLFIPDREALEEELGEGLYYEFENCFNLVEYYDGPVRQGNKETEIDFENIDIQISLLDDKVLADVKIPTTVKFNDNVYEIEDFETETDTYYLKMYEMAKEISEIQSEEDFICMTCYQRVLNEQSAKMTIEEFDTDYGKAYVLFLYKTHPVLEDTYEVFAISHKFSRDVNA